MFISIVFYLIFCCFSSFTNEIDRFTIWIEKSSNETFILNYNVSSNYSYLITFRLFEHEQFKYGLFNPTDGNEMKSIEILHHYELMREEIYYFFIICFHFIRSLNDIDIVCKDLRLVKTNPFDSENDYLPSYRPLFVPMMYALSVLMLLPVIVQHRRQKRANIIDRQRQLKRLSLSLVNENPQAISRRLKNGPVDLTQLPNEIQLVSCPSKKTIFEMINDNENVMFTLQDTMMNNIDETNYEEPPVTADECIAHLLNNTPWTRESFSRSHFVVEQEPTFHERFQQRKITSKPDNQYCSLPLYRSNPAFVESDV